MPVSYGKKIYFRQKRIGQDVYEPGAGLFFEGPLEYAPDFLGSDRLVLSLFYLVCRDPGIKNRNLIRLRFRIMDPRRIPATPICFSLPSIIGMG
jgi:hypothetical protein